MVQSSATRHGFRALETSGIVAEDPETESLWHSPESVAEANLDLIGLLRSAYLEEWHGYVRLHKETYSFALPLGQHDTWDEAEVPGLRTSELKCRGIRQDVTAHAYLVHVWQHDPAARAFGGDPFVWVSRKYREPATASEDEYPEWDWIQSNEARLRREYAGLWIAVRENSIVAIADSEVEVLRQADKLNYEDVFSFYVPTESEPAVVVVAS